MAFQKLGLVGVVAVSMSLSACGEGGEGGGGGGIGSLFSSGGPVSRGPDEFAIVPTKPLEMPQDLTALPEPDLGGPNLVDPTPEIDAAIALGGRPDRLVASGGVPSSEVAIVNAANRTGTAGNIRQTLASEDANYRNRVRVRLFERLLGQDGYFRRYQPQSLGALTEQERLAQQGVRTPTAPPAGE